MTYLNKKFVVACTLFFTGVLLTSCEVKGNFPTIQPDIITEKTANDADDPAIWINKNNPAESIV